MKWTAQPSTNLLQPYFEVDHQSVNKSPTAVTKGGPPPFYQTPATIFRGGPLTFHKSPSNHSLRTATVEQSTTTIVRHGSPIVDSMPFLNFYVDHPTIDQSPAAAIPGGPPIRKINPSITLPESMTREGQTT